MSRLTIASCLARISKLENILAHLDAEIAKIDDLEIKRETLRTTSPTLPSTTKFSTYAAAATAAREIAAQQHRSCQIQRAGSDWILV